MASPAVIGIDVGGTRIKSCVLTPSGEVLDELVMPTPKRVGASIGEVVAALVSRHRDRIGTRSHRGPGDRTGAGDVARASPNIGAVGVVVPGVVDDVRGIGWYSANLGWRDLDLRSAIADAIDLPFAVGHDVRAGLLAEHHFGAAVGADNVLFLPLGTGIASAVLSGGRLLADPRSGEIGHVVLDPEGAACECGARGCLETIASARAIGERFRRRVAADAGEGSARSSTAEVARSPSDESTVLLPVSSVDVARLVEAATTADQIANGRLTSTVSPSTRAALDVWHEAVEALAAVLAPVIVALGTETVLVGGGLVRSGETLLHPLRQAIAARLGADLMTGLGLEVRAAALGDRAGSLGAGVLALEAIGA